MDEALQNRTVLPRELEQEIWDYYRRTVPSLQEFYSRYTPEWEVFFEQESVSPVYFLAFLKQMKTAFRKRYTLSELDITYYIERMEALPADSPERRQLQEFFLDKWHELLTRKESISISMPCAVILLYWIHRWAKRRKRHSAAPVSGGCC